MATRFKKELTVEMLSDEYIEWFRDPVECLRFGQYMVNTYMRDGISAADIFYETNPMVAYTKILHDILDS